MHITRQFEARRALLRPRRSYRAVCCGSWCETPRPCRRGGGRPAVSCRHLLDQTLDSEIKQPHNALHTRGLIRTPAPAPKSLIYRKVGELRSQEMRPKVVRWAKLSSDELKTRSTVEKVVRGPKKLSDAQKSQSWPKKVVRRLKKSFAA